MFLKEFRSLQFPLLRDLGKLISHQTEIAKQQYPHQIKYIFFLQKVYNEKNYNIQRI